ncbi:MAG TPA: TetR/AcrR family transcriptional regulator [Nitrospirae bacterium]|nr:HTH-type transcriptional repressor KstR2 [bacterium BMS3Bbin09]HDO66693.1 TetR/AcrR family transcriptional regulator [Nitrospirota bacterium]HEW80867.1 TetR/AcrR family transcriptional regulator [Nitrospirota bacterium]
MDAGQVTTISRRDRKKQETKKNIIKIAMYLFRKQGFDATTMEQIAQEVDIAKGTLYNYFPVKESIICEYWQEGVKEIKLQLLELIQLLPDTRSRLQKTFTKSATELFRTRQDIYKIYLSHWLKNLNNFSSEKYMKSGFEDIFTMIIKLGHQKGDIRKDITIDLLVRQLELSFLTACMMWLADPKMYPLEENLEMAVSLFVDGAGTGSRRSRTKSESKSKKSNRDQGTLL